MEAVGAIKMGKYVFTKLVQLENKPYGIHKELGPIGLFGGKDLGCFSRAHTRESPSSLPGPL